MNSIRSFIKTTLIGGIVFIVPLVILLMVLGKAVSLARAALGPLLDDLPHIPVGDGRVALATLVCAAAVLLLCFVAGLAARTSRGGRLGEWVQWRLLSRIPGYSIWQSMARDMARLESAEAGGSAGAVKVGLLQTDDGWQLCFLMEPLKDGHIAIFVPETPSSTTGDMRFVRSDLVRPLDVSVREAVACIRRLGAGSGKLLSGAFLDRDPARDPPHPTKQA